MKDLSIIIEGLLFLSAFMYGVYIGQRKSEKINEQNRKTLVALCDEIRSSKNLTPTQQMHFADLIISTFPFKIQREIKQKTEQLMKDFGFDK